MHAGLVDSTMTDEKPKLMSVKIPMDVLESARIVSAYRGVTMTELIGDILRPALAKLEQEEITKRSQGATRRKGGK
jgi:hypothetical protein